MNNQKSTMEGQDHVEKPWGNYTVVERVDNGKQVRVKHLHINPGETLSAQYHNHRQETWYIVSGEGVMEIGYNAEKPEQVDEVVELNPGVKLTIHAGTIHRPHVQKDASGPLEVIEVWIGDTISEDDIVRVKDPYGRPKIGN